MEPLKEAAYLAKLSKAEDIRRFPDIANKFDESLQQIAIQFASDKYRPKSAIHSSNGAKVQHTAASYADVLFLRHCCRKLRRSRLRPNFSRADISKQIIQILSSDVGHRVIRTDVANFFGSIDSYVALQIPTVRNHLSSREYGLCCELLSASPYAPSPLPRGLSISNELAEHFVADTDQFIICQTGVTFYARFVDDIIAITASSQSDTLLRDMDEHLQRKNLRLSQKKTEPCDWQCDVQSQAGFSYLGTTYRRLSAFTHSGRNKVDVGISEDKLIKYQTRIRTCFKQFGTGGDFSLLRDRLRYLTGICHIKQRYTGRSIAVGIRETHPGLTDLHCLARLDGCLQTALRAVPKGLGKRRLSRDRRLQLRRLSFKASYEHNIRHRFSGSRIWEIRRVF